MSFPAELKYTKEHEWVRVEGDIAIVGITSYAQEQLGDIVYVEIETVGQEVAANEIFGTVEAVKTVSDLYMPVSGEILEKNEALDAAPESVNNDPYNEGWMIKVKMSNPSEINDLLSADSYAEMVG